jgi:DNA-binding transcriptional LysR family regulator
MNDVDLRLMRAAVAVADELSFSRAALRLGITQPGLTQQIRVLERSIGAALFFRNHHKVSLTDAGRAFVAEARLCLMHEQKAVQAARSAASGAEVVLNVGQSPYIDSSLTSVISSIHLPLFPNLRLHIFSDYSPELSRRVTSGELDIAIVAAGMDSRLLSSIELDMAPFYILYEAISERAIQLGIAPRERHHITNSRHASQLVHSTGGVAFLARREAWNEATNGLTLRPFVESDIRVRTVLVARNDAPRIVSEFMRAVVMKVRHHSRPAQQGKLPFGGARKP